MPSKDIHLEILSSHYSETFSLLKSAVERRDRLFLYMLVVIFVMLLYLSAPNAMSDRLNSFVNSRVGSNSQAPLSNPAASTNLIDTSFIGTILSLGLLALGHTYFQTVLHVEREYHYVYQLEDQLSPDFSDKAFTREGKHYKEYQRKFASWTKIIFWYLFPFLFLIFNIVWLVFLFTKSQAPIAYLAIDSLISVSILISLGFYLWALIRKS